MSKATPMEYLLNEKHTKLFQQQKNLELKPLADTDYVKPESKYQEHPYKTIGKVFFLYGGRPASCSGTATGNNTVLTAGHCVFLDGNFHENFIFVPQYNEGEVPSVGKFVASRLLIFQEWRSQDMARDVAFAIVGKNVHGKTLEEAVGKVKVGSCDVNSDIKAFGYPGPDYGAEKMVRTLSDIQRRFPLSPWTPAPIGIRSKMGPGSSGGPWIVNFKRQSEGKNIEENLACSVNSFQIRFTWYVFGPFFDRKVLEFYNDALKL